MPVRKLLRLLFRGQPQICEGCRESFTCGPMVTGCWCGDVKLSRVARQELKDKYRGCVCAGCLRKAAGN